MDWAKSYLQYKVLVRLSGIVNTDRYVFILTGLW